MALTKEQKKDRLSYIGGSDAPAVLGLSRWSSPIKVWAEKTGAIEWPDGDELYKELGEMMEDTVAKLFTKRTGKRVFRVNETRHHKNYPFLAANIDRRVVGENAILECKTCTAWKAKEWDGEEIPTEYLIQIYHYLAVTGADYAYVAVIIGNERFVWKKVERDKKIIGDIVRKEVDFWNNHVLKNEMPTTVTKNDADVLYGLFPVSDPDKTVVLDDEANKLIESRQALLQDKSVVVGELERIDNAIKLLLKDSENAQSDRYRITWKTHTRASYVVAASQQRKLNIKEIKKDERI